MDIKVCTKLLEEYPIDDTYGWTGRVCGGGLTNRICEIYNMNMHPLPDKWRLDAYGLKRVEVWFERRGDRLPNCDPWGRSIPNYMGGRGIVPIEGIDSKQYLSQELYAFGHIMHSFGKLYTTSVSGVRVYLLDVYDMIYV